MVLFCAGINLIIAVMKNSGLGEVFGAVVLSILGDTKNLYLITAVLFLGSAIATQFMNNMATAGVLAPIGISIAESMGANPQAIVLAIAIGAGCSFLTPIASGTNQTLMIFTNLKFTDFAKFGWPFGYYQFYMLCRNSSIGIPVLLKDRKELCITKGAKFVPRFQFKIS